MSEKRLYVGNLPFQITEEEIADAFSAHGTVANIDVITDRDTGRSRGFGFVEMMDDAACRNAMEALDNHMVDGRNLKVNEARPRNSGGGGGGGGGGGRRW